MAKFTYDDDAITADEFGDLSYDEAIRSVVESAVAQFEMTLWDMVDDLEYVVSEECSQPTNPEDR